MTRPPSRGSGSCSTSRSRASTRGRWSARTRANSSASCRSGTALRESLAWWREYGGPQAALAAARSWAWLETGRWLSKREAADWLVDRVLERAVQRGS